jgi:hypothetical protein
MQTHWHGTLDEYSEFLGAIGHNCACDPIGARPQGACGAHQLLRDQRTIDRLLFARRIIGRLARGEHWITTDLHPPVLAPDPEVRHA